MEKENRVSNWVRGSCIGRGSFGTVSLAVNKSDSQVFAVKSVDRNSGLESQFEALENEIGILKSISSPWVVEYLGDDATVEGGVTSFRNLHLEYMPGGSVADLAKQAGGDVDESIVRSYTWCIVSALKYVHSKGIVHCDVKGKNVLVGSAPGVAKLADFGSAAEFDAAVVAPRGSPLWMAPEVIRRDYLGPESDIWSLGCTVIEMVTGKPAWEDRGVCTLCRIGNSDELPEVTTQLSELGRDFVEKCLRRNRLERWSCDQLLQHPFISSSAPHNSIDHSSPRCVLDLSISEYCDEEGEFEVEEEIWKLGSDSVRERIEKLASKAGVIWESYGWEVVRSLGTGDRAEELPSSDCSEYPNSVTGDGEMEGTSSEYSDSMGIERSILECCSFSGGLLAVCYGSTCRYGWRQVVWAVDNGGQDFTAGVECLFKILLYFTPLACNSFRIIIPTILLLFNNSICPRDQFSPNSNLFLLVLQLYTSNFLFEIMFTGVSIFPNNLLNYDMGNSNRVVARVREVSTAGNREIGPTEAVTYFLKDR